MTPEKGVNAIAHLVCALYELREFGIDDSDFLKGYKDKIGVDYNGELFDCGLCDEPSGRLTFNVGTICKEKNTINLGINLRYPVTYEYDHVYTLLEKTASAAGFSMEIGNCMEPIFFEKDGALVEQLMKVYRKCTGDDQALPIALGGATYARAIPNAIAFGPVFPWQEELAHEANEFLSIDNLMKITEIYIESIIALVSINNPTQA